MGTCKNCNAAIEGKKTYCSDKCRMSFNRCKPNSQPEQTQSEQIKPNKAWTIADVLAMTRAETDQLLEGWRLGKGTEYQRRLGQLSADCTHTQP